MKRMLSAVLAMTLCASLFSGCIFRQPTVGPDPTRSAGTQETQAVPGSKEAVSVPDVKELFKNAYSRLQNEKEVSMHMDMTVEIQMSVMGQSVDVTLDGDLDTAKQDEYQHVILSMQTTAYGQTQGTYSEQYIAPASGDHYDVYSNDGSGWTTQTLPKGSVQLSDNAAGLLSEKLAEFLTLRSGTETYNGRDCYVADGSISWEDVQAMEGMGEMFGQLGSEDAGDLSDIRFHVVYYFDVNDGSLQGEVMDGAEAMAEVVDRAMKQSFGTQTDVQIDIKIPVFSVELNEIRYEASGAVVPQEVIDMATDQT